MSRILMFTPLNYCSPRSLSAPAAYSAGAMVTSEAALRWLPFLDTYRTLCLSPRARFRADADRDSSFGGLSMIRLCRWHRSTRGRVVGDRRLARTHSDGPVEPHLPHQAIDRAAGDVDTCSAQPLAARRDVARLPSALLQQPHPRPAHAVLHRNGRGPSSRHHCRAGLVLGDPSNRPLGRSGVSRERTIVRSSGRRTPAGASGS